MEPTTGLLASTLQMDQFRVRGQSDCPKITYNYLKARVSTVNLPTLSLQYIYIEKLAAFIEWI